MAINDRSHFAYRIDAWDADGENVIEHLAGVEDLQVAKATYLAACQRWPGTPMTLRQGTRVIEESRQTRIVRVPRRPPASRTSRDSLLLPFTHLLVSKASGAGGLLAGLRSGDFKHFEERSDMRRHRLIIVRDP